MAELTLVIRQSVKLIKKAQEQEQADNEEVNDQTFKNYSVLTEDIA